MTLSNFESPISSDFTFESENLAPFKSELLIFRDSPFASIKMESRKSHLENLMFKKSKLKIELDLIDAELKSMSTNLQSFQ